MTSPKSSITIVMCDEIQGWRLTTPQMDYLYPMEEGEIDWEDPLNAAIAFAIEDNDEVTADQLKTLRWSLINQES